MRHISQNGLKLIKSFEGFSSKIYSDAAGIPTIGYGHLILPHEKHLFQNGITEEKAISLLKQDISFAEKSVIRLINIPLSNNQFDALLSFTFNLGSASLQRSSLRRKINRQEHWDVPAELMKWVWAGGKKIAGLARRRKVEAELYLRD